MRDIKNHGPIPAVFCHRRVNPLTDKIHICAKCWPSVLIQSKVSVITTTEGQK